MVPAVRTLASSPLSLMNGSEPQFGSFAGPLPKLDFGPINKSRFWRLTHEKRWTYVAIADERVFAGMAVVSVSYATTAIAFVLDRESGELLFDKSVMGPPTATSFQDGGAGRRRATFRLGKTHLALGDRQVFADIPGSTAPMRVDVRAVESPMPKPISAVVPIEGGFANATEKRLVEFEGEIAVGGKRFKLDRALAGFDHTAGYLARHTEWRWALALGVDDAGERIALNLVEGFVGEAECGAWRGNTLHPVGEGRFDFSASRPLDPWRVRTTCGAIDLTFTPAAIHHEEKNLVLVRSKFIQPIGAFEGTIRLPDDHGKERVSTVKNLAGVTEYQDVVW